MPPRPDTPSGAPALSDAAAGLVVVGGGLAGLRVAEGARAAGFSGRIRLVGEEAHPPYDRPPLSKAVLVCDDYARQLELVAPERLAALQVELMLGRAVVRIDRAARAVAVQDGRSIAYDRLVLATGSAVRTLPDLPPDRPGVHYLRTLDDALRLRAGLAQARSVLIVGAGVIGLEVAAAAAKDGRRVTVVEAEAQVMGRAAAPPVADFIAEQHRRAGVDLRLGATIAEVRPAGVGFAVRLSDGSGLACDLAVVGVGVAPNTRLARDCGLEVEPGGVVVDGHGMTSDPAIYAAGEVALHFNARLGRRDRQETWAHAAAHGQHVGRALVQPGEAYADLGSYWSDQYDFTLNVLGAPRGEADVVRGDPAEGRFLVLHLAGGRVVGASAINAARELRAARALIDCGRGFEPEQLADPACDLRSLAKTDIIPSEERRA